MPRATQHIYCFQVPTKGMQHIRLMTALHKEFESQYQLTNNQDIHLLIVQLTNSWGIQMLDNVEKLQININKRYTFQHTFQKTRFEATNKHTNFKLFK